jgi:Transposase IS66 family
MRSSAARQAAPTYEALREQVRGSPVVSPDETSWKVAGELWWLWAFATATTVVYAIQHGRGFDEAAAVLGADFEGVLVRDGWAPYRQFEQAGHQTCLAHLIRRCCEIAEAHPRAGWPRRVKSILQDAVDVRDRLATGEISAHGAAIARGQLTSQLLELLDARADWPTATDSRRISPLNCPRSSAFSLIPGSTRRTGAPSRRFGRRSSIGRCPVAIARNAAPGLNRS